MKEVNRQPQLTHELLNEAFDLLSSESLGTEEPDEDLPNRMPSLTTERGFDFGSLACFNKGHQLFAK